MVSHPKNDCLNLRSVRGEKMLKMVINFYSGRILQD